MPRVLQIINRLNLGGPTFIAGYLAAYLGEGYETMLVAGMKDDSEESSEYIVRNMGIEPVFIDNMHREINFKADRAAYKQLDRIIKEFKPDIVQTHAAKAGMIAMIGPNRKRPKLAAVGLINSLVSNLTASAIGCNKPIGPTRLGP